MNLLEHYRLMAKYNRRLNIQVYDTASTLDQTELERDRRAFFKSISGTLNHIVVADILWLTRFRKCFVNYTSLDGISDFKQPTALNQVLYPVFSELKSVRERLDGIIVEWLDSEVKMTDLESELVYKNTRNITSRRSFSELLGHFFNHQTHHRGQVSTLLSQVGLDIGVSDFLIDIPDTYEQ
jgi:uncharacterized damage-inducible protein DinB